MKISIIDSKKDVVKNEPMKLSKQYGMQLMSRRRSKTQQSIRKLKLPSLDRQLSNHIQSPQHKHAREKHSFKKLNLPNAQSRDKASQVSQFVKSKMKAALFMLNCQKEQFPIQMLIKVIRPLKLTNDYLEAVRNLARIRLVNLQSLRLNNQQLLVSLFKVLQSNYYFGVRLANCNIRQIPNVNTNWIKRVLALNLQDNDLAFSSCKTIAQGISESQIIQLNLQNNKITDFSGKLICSSLVNCNNLKTLRLSKNSLSRQSAIQLSLFLQLSESIFQLYLHWNKMDRMSFNVLAQGLKSNSSLKVLDLSWNCLNVPKLKSKLQFKWIENLSFCQFQNSDLILLEQHLLLNQTIIGLHLQGISAVVNSRGFIQLYSLKPITKAMPHVLQRIRGLEQVPSISKTCWICNGWTQTTIKIFKFGFPRSPFIHFQFDNYQACSMYQNQNYYYIRRISPASFLFFFSFGSTYFFVYQGWKVQIGKTIKQIKFGDKCYDKQVKYFNRFKLDNQKKLMFNNFNNYNFKTLPRQFNPFFDIQPAILKVRRDQIYPSFHLFQLLPFSLQNSLFSYRFSTQKQQIIQYIKIRQLIGEQNYDQFKKIAADKKSYVDCLYLSIALKTQSNGQFYIKFKDVLSTFNACKVINNMFPANVCQIKYISSISQRQQAQYKTKADGLRMVRQQFLQFLVRVVLQKYCKGRVCKRFNQFFVKLLRKFNQVVFNVNPESWRSKNLYSQDINHVAVKYSQTLKRIFEQICKGQLLSFQQIKQKIKLDSQKQAEDNFYLSLDFDSYLNNSKIHYAQFVQFLVRQSFHNSMPLINSKTHNQKHLARRIPLCFKLQNYILIISQWLNLKSPNLRLFVILNKALKRALQSHNQEISINFIQMVRIQTHRQTLQSPLEESHFQYIQI